MRHWRWLWAAMALRLVVGGLLFLIMVVPYFVATLVVSFTDATADQLGRWMARCHSADLAKSGWVPAKIPAPALSEDWKTRAGTG